MRKKQLLLIGIVLFGLIILTSGCTIQKGSLQDRFGNLNDRNNNSGGSSGGAAQVGNTGLTTTELTFIEEIEECLEEENEAKADTCLIELAEENEDDFPCGEMVLLPKDRCYKGVALEANDDIYCGKISDTVTREDCLKIVGLETNEESTCLKIVNHQRNRDDCLLESGIAKRNSDTCKKIFDPTTKDSCYIEVADSTNDYSECEKVSTRVTSEGRQRDLCYTSTGKLPGQICAKLIEAETRIECFEDADDKPIEEIDCTQFSDVESVNACADWWANYSGDIVLCYEISNKDEIDECLYDSIDTNSTTMQTCEKIKSEDYKIRNLCFKNASINAEDESLCGTIISDSRVKNDCLIEIATIKENPAICPRKTTDYERCISRIALETADFSFCEKIITDRSYNKCYSEIALRFGASIICDKAERTNFRLLPYTGTEYCYELFAIGTEDYDICEKINQSALAKTCNEKVEIAIICKDNDNTCDDDLCSWENDNDCPSPYTCNANNDCNDNKVATEDTCESGRCVHTYINECIDGDRFCPSDCTYIGNPEAQLLDPDDTETNEDSDCVDPDEICSTDADCDDEDASTTDSCDIFAKLCVHTTITECVDNDDYCPGACTYEGDPNEDGNEDNDCLEPTPTCMLATVAEIDWADCEDSNYDAEICEIDNWSSLSDFVTCTTDLDARQICYRVLSTHVMNPEENATLCEVECQGGIGGICT